MFRGWSRIFFPARRRDLKSGVDKKGSGNAEREHAVLMSEWSECRKSIERFDTTIVDLRKYGFTLVTLLITAEAYFFTSGEAMSFQSRAAASFVIMVLILALYIIDRCQENFLRGAVARACEIEQELGKAATFSNHIFLSR